MHTRNQRVNGEQPPGRAGSNDGTVLPRSDDHITGALPRREQRGQHAEFADVGNRASSNLRQPPLS